MGCTGCTPQGTGSWGDEPKDRGLCRAYMLLPSQPECAVFYLG